MERIKGESFKPQTPEPVFDTDVVEPEKGSMIEKSEDLMVKTAEKSTKWLKDYFHGIPIEKFEPDVTTKKERLKSGGKVVAVAVAKAFGLHLFGEVPAYFLQKYSFKPKERQLIADKLRGDVPARASYRAMEERIATSEHLTDWKKFVLLNELSALAEPELSRLDWIDIIGVDGSIEQDWTVGEEKRLDEEFVSGVEAVLERHIKTEIKEKELLFDAVLSALVYAGGAATAVGLAGKANLAGLAVKYGTKGLAGFKYGKSMKYTYKGVKGILA